MSRSHIEDAGAPAARLAPAESKRAKGRRRRREYLAKVPSHGVSGDIQVSAKCESLEDQSRITEEILHLRWQRLLLGVEFKRCVRREELRRMRGALSVNHPVAIRAQ